ncbi:MAG TPA: lipopolysaccharide kinase InaA family protein [Gemmatales bacterium]|nr:lipopolysaccharide kinase InaA family protein [Gemmatales bacterium]
MNWYQRFTQGQWQTQTTPAWSSVVGDDFVKTIMDWNITDDFHAKQGRSTGRLVMNDGELLVYLKRHWQLPLMNRVLACFYPKGRWTPAVEEWQNLLTAQNQGIAVPEPLAVGQRIGPGLQLQSFLVIRELTGMLPLHQAIPLACSIMSSVAFSSWKRQLLSEVTAIARRLHSMNYFHKDLYLCHYYVEKPMKTDRSPGPLKLIDLHRFAQHRLFGWRWQIKDVAQLVFSTYGVSGLDDRDREFILQAYRGTETRTARDRWFESSVRFKAHRYARHNAVEETMSQASTGKAA